MVADGRRRRPSENAHRQVRPQGGNAHVVPDFAPPAPVGSARAPVRSALPNPDLVRSFVRFREEAARFRDEVIACGGGSLALAPEAQARANLAVVRSVFGKWSIEILAVLAAVPSCRFNDLRRNLPRISADVLSRKLYGLQGSGLVERHVGTGRPPEVDYRLTEDGLTLTRLGEPILLFLRLRAPRDASPAVPRTARRGRGPAEPADPS